MIEDVGYSNIRIPIHTKRDLPILGKFLVIMIVFSLGMTFISFQSRPSPYPYLALSGFLFHEGQDPVVEYLIGLQDDTGGFALEGEEPSIATSYQVLEFLKIYDFFNEDNIIPKELDIKNLTNFLMSRWQLEGGFAESGEGVPDIISTAKVLQILRLLDASEEIRSIRPIAYEKIREMVGGKIIWKRIMQESLEDQYQRIILNS